MADDDIRTRLDEIEAYCAAATEGPWWRREGYAEIDGKNYAEVLIPGPVACGSYCYGGSSTIDGDRLDADLAFISAARTDLPAVVAALRDALAEVKRLKPLAGEHGVWKAEALRRREEQHRLEAKVAHIEASGPDHDLRACSTFVREFSDRLMEVTHERDALAVENARLRAALTHIQRWDCLNPPRGDLLADLPWLARLVDAALATTEPGEGS